MCDGALVESSMHSFIKCAHARLVCVSCILISQCKKLLLNLRKRQGFKECVRKNQVYFSLLPQFGAFGSNGIVGAFMGRGQINYRKTAECVVQ